MLRTKMPIKLIAKFCGVAGMILIVIFALGPANWQPRTGLGWGADHVLGYFASIIVPDRSPRRQVCPLGMTIFQSTDLESRFAGGPAGMQSPALSNNGNMDERSSQPDVHQ
jgi:hypothetical protein